MDIGMLWYDDDAKRKFDEKVARAVEFYRAKYGVQPTECFVHPGMLAADQPPTAAGVRLRPNRTIIKNHFWLGVDTALTPAAKAPAKAAPAQPSGASKAPAAAGKTNWTDAAAPVRGARPKAGRAPAGKGRARA